MGILIKKSISLILALPIFLSPLIKASQSNELIESYRSKNEDKIYENLNLFYKISKHFISLNQDNTEDNSFADSIVIPKSEDSEMRYLVANMGYFFEIFKLILILILKIRFFIENSNVESINKSYEEDRDNIPYGVLKIFEACSDEINKLSNLLHIKDSNLIGGLWLFINEMNISRFQNKNIRKSIISDNKSVDENLMLKVVAVSSFTIKLAASAVFSWFHLWYFLPACVLIPEVIQDFSIYKVCESDNRIKVLDLLKNFSDYIFDSEKFETLLNSNLVVFAMDEKNFSLGNIFSFFKSTKKSFFCTINVFSDKIRTIKQLNLKDKTQRLSFIFNEVISKNKINLIDYIEEVRRSSNYD